MKIITKDPQKEHNHIIPFQCKLCKVNVMLSALKNLYFLNINLYIFHNISLKSN